MRFKGMKTWCLLATIGLSGLSNASWGQELWRGASAGDSPAQIKKLFPKAGPTRGREKSDPLEYNLYDTYVAEHEGTARFVFEKQRLKRVTIDLKTGLMSREDGVELVAAIEVLLIRKYGAPYQCDNEDDEEKHFYLCRWTNGGVRILLGQLSEGNEAGFISVTYQPKPEGLDDNL